MKLRKGIVLLALVAGGVGIAAAQAPAGAPAGGGQGAAGGRGGRGGAAPAAGGGGGLGGYPQHAQADQATIDRGKALYDTNCSFCHAPDARGGQGPNLLRSQLVMNDQTGEGIGVVVQNGRPDLGMPKFDLSAQQITDIAGYIHSFRVAGYDASRNVPTNIVVGDAKAGERFFNDTGKCSTCHSVTGDLAGIGTKRDPKSLQNAIVSGGGGGRGGPAATAPTTTVTVTQANGKVVEGKLVKIDDFLVTLTVTNGDRVTIPRDGDVPKVVVHNPLQAHIDMLPKYTDDQIHNLTAYLVTLK